MGKINVVIVFDADYNDSFDEDDMTLFIHVENCAQAVDKLKRYKKSFSYENYVEDDNDYTTGRIVRTEYDFSEDEFVIDKLVINELNNETIKLLQTFGLEARQVYLNNLSLNQISRVFDLADFKPNTLFFTKYNYEDLSTKEEIYDAIEYIHNIRDYVLQFDLSPLEQTIFVYDLLREREYKFSRYDKKFKNDSSYYFEYVGNGKDKFPISESRSLMKVVKNNSIVCVGFSNIYRAVLESLGIHCEQTLYGAKKGHDAGHVSSVVVINDSKYNLCIPVEIDPTSYRMETEGGNYSYRKSLLKYGLFARSVFGRFKSIDNGEEMFVESGGAFQQLYIRIKRLENLIDLDAIDVVIEHAILLVTCSLYSIGNKYEIPFMIESADSLKSLENYNCDVVKEAIKPIMDSLLVPVPPKTFYFALSNVKNLESEINSRKYPNSKDEILSAYETRYSKNYISEILLLERIFGGANNDINPYATDYSYVRDLSVHHNPFMSLKNK